MDSLLAALKAYFEAALVGPSPGTLEPWKVTSVRIMGPWESQAGWSVASCPVVILTPITSDEAPGPMGNMRTITSTVRIRIVMASSETEHLQIGPANITALGDRIRQLIAADKRIGEQDDYLNGTREGVAQTYLDSVGGPGKFVGLDLMQTWFRYELWTGAMNNQTTLALPA